MIQKMSIDVRVGTAPFVRRRGDRIALRPCGEAAEHDATAAEPADPIAGAGSGCSAFHSDQPFGPTDARGAGFSGGGGSQLQQSEAAKQAARRAAQTNSGSVTVGFIGATTYGFLPRLVTKARIELPNIDLTFREMTTAEQIDALVFGRIDLGLARPIADQREIVSACVMREHLALALPLDHPLAVRRRPELAQIDGEPFIMYSSEGRYMNELLTGAFRSAGIQPLYVQQMSQRGDPVPGKPGMGMAIVPEEPATPASTTSSFAQFSWGQGLWRNCMPSGCRTTATTRCQRARDPIERP